MGLPSTEDVARLADILGLLKKIVEADLRSSVDSVLVTVPMFPQICPDQIQEAAKLNGMAAISLSGYEVQLHELEASYAGYGMGLCEDYMNSTSCRDEEDNMPSSSILMASFTETALLVDWYRLGRIDYQSRFSSTYRTDWTLGSQDVPPRGSREAEAYWQRMSALIAETISTYDAIPNATHVDRLLLLGRSSEHPEFRSTVQETILQLQPDLPTVYDDDALYTAAKGAAEMAKRAGDLAVLRRQSKTVE